MTGIGQDASDAEARSGGSAFQRAVDGQDRGPDALGRLAGGIGHEFRNLLMIIQNYAEFIEEKLPPDSEAREDLAEILKAAERGAQLTNELLAFGRGGVADTGAVDVAQAVAAVEPRLRALLADGVALTVDLAPGLPAIQADVGRFAQILENVVRNAVEAIESGGSICIEANQRDLDERYAREHANVVPGSYVVVTVGNTGCPMSPEVTDQTFDAQFATTAGGRGGLGLAVVHGIVESWGGAVHVRSEKGIGTVVAVLLPCAQTLHDDAGADPAQAAGAGWRVLVCEDERAIRSMCERTLRQAGFVVLVAEDGDAGIRRLAEERAAGRRLDLVVSDIVMPGSSGFDVATAARDCYPDVSILLMTGFSEELSRRAPPIGTVVVEKPFPASLLVRRVRALAGACAGRNTSGSG